MSSQNYAFAVANIRSHEKKLVTKNQLERIMDAPNPSSFFDALSETAYAKFFQDFKKPSDFQKIISLELADTKKLLSKVAPYPEKLDWLWLKYDFANLKYAIKAYLAQKEIAEDELNDLGSIKNEEIIKYLGENDKGHIDQSFLKVIDEAKEIFEKEKNPHAIDVFLDKKYFEFLEKEISKVKSKNICNLIRSKIDLYNLKLLIRYKYLKKERKDFDTSLVDGGHIEKEYISQAFDKSWEEIPKIIKLDRYDLILKAGIKYLTDSSSYMVFEKLSYEHMMDELRFARYESFGLEPIVAYWLAKDNEAKVLRTVMVSKIGNIKRELIHEQIHKLYTEK